jgi:hypothetical protein
VVLDGGDLAQASVGITALLRHLTSWSPSLLKYSSKETKVSTIDKLYDGENWLSPVVDDEQSDRERPRWHLRRALAFHRPAQRLHRGHLALGRGNLTAQRKSSARLKPPSLKSE